MKIEVKVFWIVMPCSVVVILGDLATSIFRVKVQATKSSKTLAAYCNIPQHYNPEDLILCVKDVDEYGHKLFEDVVLAFIWNDSGRP
jgi:hypothetical protein